MELNSVDHLRGIERDGPIEVRNGEFKTPP